MDIFPPNRKKALGNIGKMNPLDIGWAKGSRLLLSAWPVIVDPTSCRKFGPFLYDRPAELCDNTLADSFHLHAVGFLLL